MLTPIFLNFTKCFISSHHIQKVGNRTMLCSNQFFMILAVSAIIGFLAAEVAEKATTDFRAALRECILTLGVFAACVFFFSRRQRPTKKPIKRFDEFGYKCPPPQRIRTQTLAARGCSKSLADEASKMVTEHTQLVEVLRSFAREGDRIKAAMAMKMLEDKCGTPGLPEYHALVAMCSKANDVEGVRMWMRRLKDKGHAPSVVCFNALINAYAKLGEISKAAAVVREMKEAGVDCDVVTYNTIIDACVRKGDAADAQIWMKKLLAAGVNPSVVSFCSVMRACAKASLISDLEYWMEQADARGIQLNMICFSAVINAFAQNGDLTSAEFWLTRMTKCNVKPSLPCFTGMVDEACKKGDMQGATRILCRMREARVVPDARVLTVLVKAACHAREFECAQDLIDEFAKKGISLNMHALPASYAAKLTMPSDVNSAKLCSNEAADETFAQFQVNSDEAQGLVGKRFVGTIKEFITSKFGYVTCEETHAVFKRDIYLSNCENPQQLAKGQMVSFVLQVDNRHGKPRASDLKIFQKQ